MMIDFIYRKNRLNNRFDILFYALGVTITFPTLVLLFHEYTVYIWPVFFSITAILAVLVIAKNKHILYVGFLLVVPAIITLNFSEVYELKYARLFNTLAFGGHFSFVFYHLAKYMVNSKSINLNTIYCAISCYLIFAVIASQLVFLLEYYYPKSFDFFTDGVSKYICLYYTIITMSTIGFGDITPLTMPAQGLTVMIGLAGHFYQTIVIALLIGKYITSQVRKD